MTVVSKLGRLEFTFDNGSGGTRRESITGIVPGAADQDVYDVGTAIAEFVSDLLVRILQRLQKL